MPNITWEPTQKIGLDENVWEAYGFDEQGNEYNALVTYDCGEVVGVEEVEEVKK